MIKCELKFKQKGILSRLHPATKQLIIDDICGRLEPLLDEMSHYPNGTILATYEDEHLVLEIKGFPGELASHMEQLILSQSPRPLHSPFSIDEIRKN